MNPLKNISSGNAVLKIAYNNAGNIPLTPKPWNSDVAVSIFFTIYNDRNETERYTNIISGNHFKAFRVV